MWLKTNKKTLVNDLPAMQVDERDVRDEGLILGLGRYHKYLKIR